MNFAVLCLVAADVTNCALTGNTASSYSSGEVVDAISPSAFRSRADRDLSRFSSTLLYDQGDIWTWRQALTYT